MSVKVVGVHRGPGVHGETTPGEARRDATITDLRKKLATKTRRCTLLERQLKAAAIAIVALHHDNEALRDELSLRERTTIVSIGTQRTKAPRG